MITGNDEHRSISRSTAVPSTTEGMPRNMLWGRLSTLPRALSRNAAGFRGRGKCDCAAGKETRGDRFYAIFKVSNKEMLAVCGAQEEYMRKHNIN